MPLALTARLWYPPPATAMMRPAAAGKGTGAGVLQAAVPQFGPNWPYELLPHAQSAPFASSARLWMPPATTAVMRAAPFGKAIAVGVLHEPEVQPGPSWLLSLSPQAQTTPLASSAKLWAAPALMATMRPALFGNVTATGALHVALLQF